MQKAKKKTYKNGLRVITVPMKDNPTVTVLVLVGTGSDYETSFARTVLVKGYIYAMA